MALNIPDTDLKRIVIIGGGFAGVSLARKLIKQNYQIVLIDKNNYHQFQPLFYQVATAGLEPSAISFPLRKAFQSYKNFHIRVTEVTDIMTATNEIMTKAGLLKYDHLVIAIGANTNFFGLSEVQKNAIPMKSVSEALNLRNTILENYEKAVMEQDTEKRQGLMNIVIVGGGPTGVEVSGTIAEMKKMILPKDYPELNFSEMQIYLLEASPRLLNGMSDISSEKAKFYLEELGVKVLLKAQVTDYDGDFISLASGEKIRSNTVVWAAGVTGNKIKGLRAEAIGRANRLKVDQFNKIVGYENIYALGDIALMNEEKYPNGHPQVAQVAIQQAVLLGKNFVRNLKKQDWQPFSYKDLGSMATVGRHLAVVDLPFLKFQGFLAWIFWMFVHLMSIIGVKNRLLVLVNWVWNYFTYDQSLRLIIRASQRKNT